MKKLRLVTEASVLVTLGLALTFGSGPARAQQPKEQGRDILFLWAFGATVEKEHKQELISVARDMALKSGDRIKFFFGGEEKEGVIAKVFPKKVYLKADFPRHKGKMIIRSLAELEGKIPKAKKKEKATKEKKAKPSPAKEKKSEEKKVEEEKE